MLTIGEIQTPSQCSRWTSESACSDKGAVEKETRSSNSTASSNGEEYRVSEGEESSGTETDTSDKDYVEDSKHCDTEETTEEDDSCYTEDTSECEESWEPDDISSKLSAETNTEASTIYTYYSSSHTLFLIT